MRSTIRFVLVTLLAAHCPIFADGERDNDPQNVRRIPREGISVPSEKSAVLKKQLSVLQARIAELQKAEDRAVRALISDVMIFERAVRCALEYNEFFSPRDVDKASWALSEGLRRADQLAAGRPEWTRQRGLVVRGFVSRIDGTVQPYGLVIPASYDTDHTVEIRCDIWFHGRGETLSELNFLWNRMHNAGRYEPAAAIVLHPYGRYSNAFKFAGEADVFEALEDVRQRYRIDDDRISVRGFSMGGAACWQFAVHFPGRWFAANPGAGFAETPRFLEFFQKEKLQPKPWVRTLWNLYDCDRYAGNLAHCPTIAYSGEKDIQKQAADVMAAALLEHGIQLRHIIGPDMGHSIDDGSKATIETAMGDLARRGRQTDPRRVDFTTYTLKYNKLAWVTVDGLDQHWRKARIIADRLRPAVPHNGGAENITVRTENISAFHLDFPAGTFSRKIADAGEALNVHVTIQTPADSDRAARLQLHGPFSDGSAYLYAHKNADGKWADGEPTAPLRKRHDLQGPIDDAFMDSFAFVRPTGQPYHRTVGEWAQSELKRATEHWRRHFRGDARVVNDNEVTDQMIRDHHLVLWGDPSSNSVLRRITDALPVQWDAHQIQAGQHVFDAEHHAVVMVYPNPLNPQRYVVLNSGFTYRDYAYLNNARQVPMLPDWAVIDLRTSPGTVWPGEVAAADFFDERWQFRPRRP